MKPAIDNQTLTIRDNHPSPLDLKISVNLSDAFVDKANHWPNSAAYSKSFYQHKVSARALLEHIAAGKAYTLGAFTTNRRHTDFWHSSQLLGLDFDNLNMTAEELAANPFIARFGLSVYPTPSSTPSKPKSRVLFLLEAPITHLPEWEAIQAGLLKHFFNLGPDRACKDAARLFFGSTKSGHITIANIMPLSVAYDLISNTPPPPPPPVITAGDSPASRLEAYAAAGHKCNIESVIKAGKGARNETLYRAAVRSFSLALAGGLSVAAVERDMSAAAESCGLDSSFTRAEIARTIASARDNATPAQLPEHRPDFAQRHGLNSRKQRRAAAMNEQPDAAPVQRFQLVDLEQFKPDVIIEAEYLPDDLPTGDLLIKSDMGTGKTTTIAKMTRNHKPVATMSKGYTRVLIITHRQALSASLAAPYRAENYNGLDAADLRRIDRLAITYDSLPKLITPDAPAPVYDYVILDEIEQGLAHLGGGTLNGKKDRAEAVYSILKAIVSSAGRVIGMDAHAAATSQKWLKSLRKDVTAIENRHARRRAPLTVYEHKSRLIDDATAAADENAGTVVIACGSVKEVIKLERYFAARYSPENVFSIHGDNSHEPDRQAFIRNVNTVINQYRVVIYSPSVGSGVDIQAPVRLVAGLFAHEPLNAAECHQMLNRCRNAAAVKVWVQKADGTRETDANAIYQTGIDNAIRTGKVSGFNAAGLPVASDGMKSLHKLLSLLEAYSNASKNRLYDHFMTLATGYESINYNDLKPDAVIAAQLDEIAETIKAETKVAVLAADPVTWNEYELAQNTGQLTAAVRYGYARHKIEQAAGREIDSELYDILHEPDARAALYLLADVLHADINELKAADQRQAKRIIGKRRHAMRKVTLLRHFIFTVFGRRGINADDTFSHDDIESRVKSFMAVCDDELRRLFGHRSDQSQNAVPVLRWILGKLGLKLESMQARRDGERIRLYRLDAALWATMSALADTCRARMEADQAAAADDAARRMGAIHWLSQNVGVTTKPLTRVKASAAAAANLPPHLAAIDWQQAAKIDF